MPQAKLKPKGQITIPKPVRDQLGLSEGDLVEIEVEGGRGVIRDQRVVPAAPAAQADSQAAARADQGAEEDRRHRRGHGQLPRAHRRGGGRGDEVFENADDLCRLRRIGPHDILKRQ